MYVTYAMKSKNRMVDLMLISMKNIVIASIAPNRSQLDRSLPPTNSLITHLNAFYMKNVVIKSSKAFISRSNTN